MTPPNEPPNTLGDLGDPSATERDPRTLRIGYLDWYRNRVTHKVSGLSEAQLTTPVEPLGWSPLTALGRILCHLLQEYARHVGQLDVARELIDGTTGE